MDQAQIPTDHVRRAASSGRLEGVAPLGVACFMALVAYVVSCILAPNLLNWHQRKAMINTEAALRTIASAVESYEVTERHYPSVPATHADPLEELADVLEPTYIERLPRVDGWGTLLVVESSAREYTITSLGKDRRADRPGEFSVSTNGVISDLRGDIIFSTGSFVQFHYHCQY